MASSVGHPARRRSPHRGAVRSSALSGLRPAVAIGRRRPGRPGRLGVRGLRRRHAGRRISSRPNGPRFAGSPTWPACRRARTEHSSAGADCEPERVGRCSLQLATMSGPQSSRRRQRRSSDRDRRALVDHFVGPGHGVRPSRPRRRERPPGRCRAAPSDRRGRCRVDVIAVVATAGATNNGAVDDLEAVAALLPCSRTLDARRRRLRRGRIAVAPDRGRSSLASNSCDSITIDPHKWLFTPYDCGAVIYRDRRTGPTGACPDRELS